MNDSDGPGTSNFQIDYEDGESKYYKMDNKKRGYALIFNHEIFKDGTGKREGSSIDVEMLRKCLDAKRFDTKVFDDLPLKQIREEIKKAVEEDHSDADCIAVVFLTHGTGNKVKAYDKDYDLKKEIFKKFTAEKCPSLAGKPKIFILQTCRGIKTDPGFIRALLSRRPGCLKETEDVEDVEDRKGSYIPPAYELPLLADFIQIYATSPEHVAFRHQTKGSYFIKVLCEELEKHGLTLHLTDILIDVNNRVATEFKSQGKSQLHKNKRQMPVFESSLTKRIHFGYPNVNSPIYNANINYQSIRRRRTF